MATPRTSAGLLPFRRVDAGQLEVLIGHMGGPFWAKKDQHAWSVFKGEYDAATEDALVAAKREFQEETGQPAPDGDLIALGEVKQSGGKRVIAWAVDAPQLEPAAFVSNTFSIEWPPRSGKQREFPEVDRAEWVSIDVAREKLVKGQLALLAALESALTA